MTRRRSPGISTARRLDKMRLCALLIDAAPFAGQQMVAALAISQDGRKTILGIRQGATENATVVGELLGDLMNRGLDFGEPRLYVNTLHRELMDQAAGHGSLVFIGAIALLVLGLSTQAC